MAIPRAQLGGAFNSGFFPPTSRPIDVASAFDAAISGGENLVRQAFNRQQARVVNAREQQRIDLEQKHYGDQQAYQAGELDLRKREVGIRELEGRRKAMTEGITPAHDEAVPGRPAGNMLVSAMLPRTMPGVANMAQPAATAPLGGDRPAQEAAPYTEDVATPGPTVQSAMVRTPAIEAGVRHVPDTYDPRNAVAYDRATDVARLNAGARVAAATAARTAAWDRLEESARLTAERQADHDRRTATTAAGRQARGLTANAALAWRAKMADGVIQNHDGDLSAAETFIGEDPHGKTYAKNGLTAEDLYAAAGRYRGHAADAATRQLGSSSPARAVERVGEVRRLTRPGAAAATPTDANAAPAKPPAAGTPKAPANAPAKSITKDEYAALIKKGRTDAEIRTAYSIKP